MSSTTGSAGPMMPPPPPPGGSGHQPPPPGGQGHQPPPPPPHAQAELGISLRDSPQNPALTWTLTCSPSGGSLPDPSRACWELSRASHPFAPLARDVSCSMIFYGQHTVSITGYWYGSRISIEVSRTDSCQEAKWNEVIAALGLNALTGEVNPGGPMKPGPGGAPSTT
ncbi:MAG: SSI family serine proteinase inhibitor [Streptosporangiaceae bacterium]